MPPVAGELADLELKVGDDTFLDFRSAFTGVISRWSVTSSDPTVAEARSFGNGEAWIHPRQVGTVEVTVVAQNTGGATQLTFTVRVVPRETTGETTAPPAIVATLAPVALSVGGSSVEVDVAAAFTPAGVPIEARSRNPDVATAAVVGSVVILTPVSAGHTSVEVTAQNAGGSATLTMTVTVTATAPRAVGTLAPVSLSVSGSSVEVDVAAAFTPAGVPIEARSRNPDVATAAVVGSVVILTPVGAGSTSVEVTAQNAGGSATLTIAVTVAATAPRAVGTLPPLSLSVGGSPVEVDVGGAFSPSGLGVAATSQDTQVVTVTVSGSVLTITPVGEGSTTIAVTARNNSGSARQDIPVTVTAAPPRVTGTGSESVTIRYRTSLTVPLSELFTTSGFAIEVESSNDQVATAGLRPSDPSRLVIDAVGPGQATVTVTASNAAGSATYTFQVTVPALTPPTVVGTPQPLALTVGDPPARVDLDSLLSAPEGLDLMVEARSGNPSVVTATTSRGTIGAVIVTPVGGGTTTVTVEAENRHGSASVSIPVTVTAAGAPTTIDTAYTVDLVHGGSPAGLELHDFFDAESPESLTLEVASEDDTIARVETEELQSGLGVLGYFVWIWPDGAGDTNVVVTVRNASGSASLTFPVSVAVAQPLTVVEEYPAQTVTVGAGVSPQLSRYVSPPGFRVEARSRDEDVVIAKGAIEGPAFSFRAVAPGQTTIDVTAINAAGSVTLEVEVTVVESLLYGQTGPR